MGEENVNSHPRRGGGRRGGGRRRGRAGGDVRVLEGKGGEWRWTSGGEHSIRHNAMTKMGHTCERGKFFGSLPRRMHAVS